MSDKSKTMLKYQKRIGVLEILRRTRSEGLKESLRRFRSLYKGFTLHLLAIIIWTTTVPTIAQLGFLNSPWVDKDQRDIKFKDEYDEYDEELESIKDFDLRAAKK